MAENHELGRYGEELTARFLTKYGFEILDRNYRIRGGEIDIIARRYDVIVFTEVKTRHFSHEYQYGTALESIDKWKRRHIIKTAERWIYTHSRYSNDFTYRFDVSVITVYPDGKCKLSYLKSAFTKGD
ncbi:MAG: YraN family protein [Ruminococcus sp.]|jgi:putative endonuclease|nr:YraN family protein [Ruminococcus sp.]